MLRRVALLIVFGLQVLSAQPTPDEKAIADYRLTAEKVTKLGTALQSLNKLAASDPRVVQYFNAPLKGSRRKGYAVSDMSGQMEAGGPKLRSAVTRTGLTTREFVTAMLALMQAARVAAAMDTGELKELPAAASKQNVACVRANQGAVNGAMAESEKLARYTQSPK